MTDENAKSFEAGADEKAEKILSAIHFATSELYCQERIKFSNPAAKFHLELAASQGHLEAKIILGRRHHISWPKSTRFCQVRATGVMKILGNFSDKGKKYLQLKTDTILDKIHVLPNQTKGFKYLQAAADNGDLYSNYWIARAYHTGNGLPDGEDIDLNQAIKYYWNLNEEITNFDIPFYSILGNSISCKFPRLGILI